MSSWFHIVRRHEIDRAFDDRRVFIALSSVNNHQVHDKFLGNDYRVGIIVSLPFFMLFMKRLSLSDVMGLV